MIVITFKVIVITIIVMIIIIMIVIIIISSCLFIYLPIYLSIYLILCLSYFSFLFFLFFLFTQLTHCFSSDDASRRRTSSEDSGDRGGGDGGGDGGSERAGEWVWLQLYGVLEMYYKVRWRGGGETQRDGDRNRLKWSHSVAQHNIGSYSEDIYPWMYIYRNIKK